MTNVGSPLPVGQVSAATQHSVILTMVFRGLSTSGFISVSDPELSLRSYIGISTILVAVVATAAPISFKTETETKQRFFMFSFPGSGGSSGGKTMDYGIGSFPAGRQAVFIVFFPLPNLQIIKYSQVE